MRIEHAVRLRPINMDDTANVVKWRNSPDVKTWLYTQDNMTEEQHISWMCNNVHTGLCYQFIIEIPSVSEGYIPIGTIFIKNIDRHNNKGEFGMFIGEASARGKGYAKFAVKEILSIAFKELNLNRVYLTVFSDNIKAIKAYERAGFIKEGVLKQDFYRSNRYADVVYMGITADVWKNHE